VAAVEVNFDGITYAKGASVLKQLVAYVGLDTFVTGLRDYFAKHAWGNATFDDLLSALETASGRELRGFSKQWLETAQVNTLRPVIERAPDGTYARVGVVQEAPAEYPTLRTHRIGVGLYDLVGSRLIRRELVEVTISGAETEIAELRGKPRADVLLLNDDDLSYTKLRLDEHSMETVVNHISGLDSSLARALCWSAAWDMVRDGELAARDYVALICNGLPAERDISLVTASVAQAQSAVTYYADPDWARTGWALLAATARRTLTDAEPGSGFQLAWARAYISTARSESELALLRDWLAGDPPDGLVIEAELRWRIVGALAAGGQLGEAEIQAELDRDRTASGERQAATAGTLLATPAAKESAWRRVTGPEPLPNWLQRALLIGFYHPSQLALTAPYVTRFFEVIDHIWATRDSEPAQEFVELAYPSQHVNESTHAATEAWLAGDHPAPLRRLVAEGRDGILRAMRARAKDATSG
jgi:aminopeptidase N